MKLDVGDFITTFESELYSTVSDLIDDDVLVLFLLLG